MAPVGRLRRVGSQILVTLSIFTVVFLLFYIMSTDIPRYRYRRSRRVGGQILVALSIFTVVFLLFYIMSTDINRYRYRVENDDSAKQNDDVREGNAEVNNKHKTQSNAAETKKDSTKNKHSEDKNESKSGNSTRNDKTSSVLLHQTESESVNSTIANQASNRTRYLIYLCDRYRSCGGWGDRQRGIPGAYVMSIVTGRRFGINMSYPCDIKTLFVPNDINWYVKVNDIKGLSWEIVDWMDNRHHSVDCENDFNERHPSDVVFLRTNQDVIIRITRSKRYGHLVPVAYRSGMRAWGLVWNQLMRPSYHFEEHLDLFLSKVPSTGDLVCAHIRIRKNKDMPNDSKPINSLSTLGSLWEFLSRFEKNASRIFIATDSTDVRDFARKNLGKKELDTGGLVMHIDRQGKWNNACVAFETAVLEQQILALCHKLVITHSGFSIRAAMMSKIQQDRYMFVNGTIRPWHY